MARGRLIWPVIAVLQQLDTDATAADPDGAGPLTSGYDDDFREPVVVPPVSGSDRGTVVRVETPLRLPCQYEPGNQEDLRMDATGRNPNSLVRLVFHFSDLEDAGLIDTDGRPLIRINDRLDEVRDYNDDSLIERFPDPPGLYATQVQSRSFGLSALKRNLVLVTFMEREVSARATG